tara:strand:+ start:102 stop:590 length:489 start_codon:yes stop_codon:yes gene_type:complete
LIEDIKKWIQEFVSEHNTEIGQVPCPFAKEAMLKERIDYVSGGKHTITPLLNSLATDWNDKYEVVVLYMQKEEMTPTEVTDMVDKFNKDCMDNKIDIVALEDHPDDPEILNGVSMNFGKAILILVQRLTKLNWASKILKKKGYYDNWPEENYNDVVKWRFKS